MKTRKRLLALFLSAMLLLSACGGSPAGGETASEGGGSQTEGEGAGGGSELSPAMQAVVDSVTAENAQATGVCGPDIVWYFKDGVLVLEGTGPMTDYAQSTGPIWRDFYEDINMIYIPEGVTTVGDWTFYDTYQLSRVVLPSTLESIGEHAFDDSGLTSITIPDGVTEIGGHAFGDCEQLKELTIPASVTSVGSYIYGNNDGGRLIFLGDAPVPMYEDDVNFYDHFFNYDGYDEVTVIYYGEGFEPYIEAYRDYPSIQWVKG